MEVDPTAPATVGMDRRRMAQVLTNLLHNADAYAGGATRVVVAGTPTSLLLAVDDAGPGIPPGERERLFERFARGSWSESTAGTGLGLALAVEHVRLHDGRIWIDDAADGGARFVIEVPTAVGMSRRRRAALLVVVVVGVSACGVSTDDRASRVPNHDVPFGLLEQNSGARPSNPGGAETSIFLVKNDRLAPTVRRIDPSARPQTVLRALERGPTKEEVAAGLRSALPETHAVDVASLAAGTVTVELDPAFTTLPSGDQLLALAQLVFTLTARPGIGQVRFTLEGQAIEVPRADGSLVATPVSRDDYAAVAPV